MEKKTNETFGLRNVLESAKSLTLLMCLCGIVNCYQLPPWSLGLYTPKVLSLRSHVRCCTAQENAPP